MVWAWERLQVCSGVEGVFCYPDYVSGISSAVFFEEFYPADPFLLFDQFCEGFLLSLVVFRGLGSAAFVQLCVDLLVPPPFAMIGPSFVGEVST